MKMQDSPMYPAIAYLYAWAEFVSLIIYTALLAMALCLVTMLFAKHFLQVFCSTNVWS
jgi:hypothetical protein